MNRVHLQSIICIKWMFIKLRPVKRRHVEHQLKSAQNNAALWKKLSYPKSASKDVKRSPQRIQFTSVVSSVAQAQHRTVATQSAYRLLATIRLPSVHPFVFHFPRSEPATARDRCHAQLTVRQLGRLTAYQSLFWVFAGRAESAHGRSLDF